MKADYAYLNSLRQKNAAWKLLRADTAAFAIAFFNRAFIESNVRVIAEPELTEKLEDELYFLRESYGSTAFPRSAQEYLYEWSEPDKGWLRRFYAANGDEPYFDLTPAAEKAVEWTLTLVKPAFVGTESRLKLIFELLRQIVQGSEEDPGVRIAELEKRQAETAAEIARIKNGGLDLLDDTGVRDRFQQFSSLARELLSDFREVEYNFRTLDREVRRKIALSTAAKGALLDEVLGKSDSIEESDQGRSFNAFYQLLLSPERQTELHSLLDKVFSMEAVSEASYDSRLPRISDSWLEAGDHTLAVMRQLSSQLRQFLDGRVWLENRRITEILQKITKNAIAVADKPPAEDFMELDEPGVEINLAMERPLFEPLEKRRVDSEHIAEADDETDDSALYNQFFVDRDELLENIRKALAGRSQVSLAEVTALFPIKRGLAEAVAYMSLASESDFAWTDDEVEEELFWFSGEKRKRAVLPKIIFSKNIVRTDRKGAGSQDGK